MDVFKNRIKQIRGDLTYEQFAQELTKSGMPFGKGNLWRYENEATLTPSFAFFYAVGKRFNVNLNWLIVGDGEMLMSDYILKSKKRVPKGSK